MPNGTQLAFDNFTRGVYPTALGGGDGWTAVTGTSALNVTGAGILEVSAINTNCGALWTGFSWAADQYSEMTLGTVPPGTADTSLYVRMDASAANGYRLDVHSTIATLFSFASGTPTQILNKTGLTVNAGDVFRLTAIGTTFVVTQNDTTIGFVSDATVATGSAGCFMYNQFSTTTSTMASWRGGIPSGNTNGIWTKKGVVIPANSSDIAVGTGIPGASNITVIREGNAQILSGTVFKAWFQGKANIYYAESSDGITWSRRGAAVVTSVGIPKVFKNGATYYMHVTHAPNVWTQIDQYTSSDGITWTLAHANILAIGAGGSWDSANVFYFQVLAIITGTWNAIYTGSDGTTTKMGLATSPDGVTWTKSGSNPVSTSHGGPDQAIKIGNNYYCWLTDGVPGQTGTAMGCIVRYHTSDFITWTRDAMALQADSVDEGRNYAPGQISVASVIEASGTTYCFYSASPDDVGAGCYQQRLATTPQTVAQIVAGGQEYFTGYTQVVTDTFQRADGGLGANWTTITGNSALQIASHLVEPSAANTNCGAYYSGSSFNNNQYADVVLATLADSNSFLGPEARVDNASSNHYAPSFSGAAGTVHNVGLYKAVSGVAYLLGSNTTITPQIGDILRISCVGTDISFFQNEHLLLQETDASLASGFPGVGMFNVTTIANSQISSFVGGNITPFVPPTTGSSSGSMGGLGYLTSLLVRQI
jgi:hypothetical protein